MRTRRYSDEQLQVGVTQSRSIRQVLLYLGLAPLGGNYATVRKRINELRLDTKHFKGRGWSIGQSLSPKRNVEDYLNNRARTTSYRLKHRLLRIGMLEPKCAMCGGARWLDQAIPLELDHINGDPADNGPHNLRLLCPNCHALTPTYRSRRRTGLSSGLQSP